MRLPKFIAAAILASTTSFSAFAADCYKNKTRGKGVDVNAGTLFLTFQNRATDGLTLYVKARDHEKEAIWLAPDEKVTRTVNLRRSKDCEESETEEECSRFVHNEIKLGYDPFNSGVEIELLHFRISNKNNDGYKDTRYNPHSNKQDNVSCKLTWRPNLQRWDLDLKFK
ncbi:MAG: hypothetical protein AAFV37_06360 [Pseudomonadota bacterium]